MYMELHVCITKFKRQDTRFSKRKILLPSSDCEVKNANILNSKCTEGSGGSRLGGKMVMGCRAVIKGQGKSFNPFTPRVNYGDMYSFSFIHFRIVE